MKKALLWITASSLSLLIIAFSSADAQTLVDRYDRKVAGTPYHNIVGDHDGNVLVYEYFDHVDGEFVGNLAKLDANGSPVAGFQKVITDGTIGHVKVQDDGKILISGDFTTINGNATPNLVRLNPDGTADVSFSSALDGVGKFELQNDGKIIVIHSNGLMRLNIDGSVDNQFSMTGSFYLNGPLEVGPDDYIYFTTFSQLYRLKPNGEDDPDFYVGSGVNQNYITSIATQSDGKILVGGFFTEYNGVASNSIVRVLPNGQVDTEFDIGVGPEGQVFDIVERANKNILIGGQFPRYNQQPASLVELKPNGLLNKIVATVATNNITSIVESADGKVTIAGGFSHVNGFEHPFLVRFNVDNTINSAFDPFLTYNNPNGRFLEVTNSGRVITGAYLDFLGVFEGSDVIKKEIVQMNALGGYDNSFSPKFPGNNPHIVSIALQEDRKMLLGGFVQDFDQPNLVRLNADGSKDDSFQIGTGPTTNSNLAGMPYRTKTKDNIIYIAGNFEKFNGVASESIVGVDLNGTIVKTFSALPANSQINDFDFQSDRKIVVLGSLPFPSGGKNVVRLNTDGTLDDTFGLTRTTGNLHTIKTDDTDRIYLAGSFITVNGALANSLVRLLPDGNLDVTFNIQAGFDENVVALEVLPGGNLAVGGHFTKFNDEVANGFVMLDESGARVPTPLVDFGKKSATVTMKYFNGALYLGGRFVKGDYSDVFGIAKISIDPLTLPTAPDGLTIAMVSDGTLQLEWNDNSSNELGFILERAVGSESEFAQYDTLAANTVTTLDHEVEPYVEFRYRVKAEGDAGASDYSNITVYKWTPAPVAQLNLTVTEQNENEILLAWDGAVDHHDGFIIERSENPTSHYAVLDTVAANSNTYVDVVEIDKKYFYKIAAYNSGGRTFSNEVSMIISGVETGEAPVSIFPVPADQFIYARIDFPTVEGQWHLINTKGQYIPLRTTEMLDGIWRMDIQHIPSGVYIMQYLERGTIVSSQRIAVQR